MHKIRKSAQQHHPDATTATPSLCPVGPTRCAMVAGKAATADDDGGCVVVVKAGSSRAV